MALIGNYSVYDKLPLKYCTGQGSLTAGGFGARGNYSESGRVRNRMMQDQTSAALKLYALPNGAYPSLSWFIAQTSGQIGSSNQIYGSGISTNNLAGGLSAAALVVGNSGLTSVIAGTASLNSGITGSGQLSCAMSAIGALLASLNATGGLSGTPLAAAAITASLNGTGTVTPTLVGAANLLASLSGAGTISNANLTLLARILADLVGSGALASLAFAQGNLAATLPGSGSSSATILAQGILTSDVTGTSAIHGDSRATGFMSSSITGQSELSPQNLAAAVWSALAAQYNAAGTMGNKLNAASAGGIDYATLAAAIITAMNANPPLVNVDAVKANTNLIPALL